MRRGTVWRRTIRLEHYACSYYNAHATPRHACHTAESKKQILGFQTSQLSKFECVIFFSTESIMHNAHHIPSTKSIILPSSEYHKNKRENSSWTVKYYNFLVSPLK